MPNDIERIEACIDATIRANQKKYANVPNITSNNANKVRFMAAANIFAQELINECDNTHNLDNLLNSGTDVLLQAFAILKTNGLSVSQIIEYFEASCRHELGN